MEENLLSGPIKEFFTKIIELKGTLRHIERILLRNLDLIRSKNLHSEDTFIYDHLIIGDLTGPNKNGWKINYPTGITRVVENYQEEINSLVQREAAFLIAQAYESFSTFLKDIIATYLFLNKNLAIKLAEEFQNINDLQEYRNTIRNLAKSNRSKLKGKNNSGLFDFIRSHSVHFKNFETHNNNGININDWYEIYSEVRHAITHSGNNIKKENIKHWSKYRIELFKEYFSYEEKESSYKLIISRLCAEDVLILISEIAFQIFKFLSIEANVNWKILYHMNQ